jgi:hypothetical protein
VFFEELFAWGLGILITVFNGFHKVVIKHFHELSFPGIEVDCSWEFDNEIVKVIEKEKISVGLDVVNLLEVGESEVEVLFGGEV